jgi:hypothetical protein
VLVVNISCSYHFILVIGSSPLLACAILYPHTQELYKCMPGRSKDYIRGEKKPNGYQSLHETIYGEQLLPGRGKLLNLCLWLCSFISACLRVQRVGGIPCYQIRM